MRFWENCYPYIFGLVFGGVVFAFKWGVSDVNYFEMILNATITISAIIIAFLATMISILITLTNSNVMKKIKDNNAQNTLTSYIMQTITAGLILSVYSLALFMIIDYSGGYSNILLTIFVFLVSVLIFSSFRIVYINSKILKSVLNEQKQESKASPTMFRPSINRDNKG